MSTLRNRLEAKKRRRIVVPIQVESPENAAASLVAAQNVLLGLEAIGKPEDDEAVLAATRRVAEATEEHKSCFVDVEFQSIPPADMEALAAMYRKTDDDDDDDGIDLLKIVAPLAAASAVDESLQDEGWWTEQLAQDTWTHGEKMSLAGDLININYRSPAARVPKD